MKKFILMILMITGFAGVSLAQTTNTLKTTLTGTKTKDTCTNMVDTVYFVFNAANLKNGSLQVTADRISGSPVLTVFLEQSNNGTLWSQKSVADTINLKPLANAVKSGTFAITQNNYLYYRLRVIGHAAAAAQIRGWSCTRRD